jgi:hypothetical protein
VLKAVLKGGFFLYETGRQTFSEAVEESTGAQTRRARTARVLVPSASKREDEEAVIGIVRPAEERAVGGYAKVRRLEKKQEKKAEKSGGRKPGKLP